MLNSTLLQIGTSGIMNFLPIILMVIVFYFFMIRPQMKKAKDLKKFVSELKKGDKVITTAGIHGRIADLNETTIVLETEGGGKIRFEKASVSIDSTKALASN